MAPLTPAQFQELSRILARDTKGHRRWLRVLGSPRSGPGDYFVYVIEVEPLCHLGDYDFYVGSTGRTVEERFAVHLAGGSYAAAIFRHSERFPQGQARPVRLCRELMLGAPPFAGRRLAEQAEGILAARIAARNFRVASDKLAGP